MKKIEPSNPITKEAPPIPKAEVKVLKTLGKPDGETQTQIASLQEVPKEKSCFYTPPLKTNLLLEH